MDESPPNPTPAEPSTPTRGPNVMPSRAIRAGAGMSAVGGLGAVVGFFLPWFIFLAVVQVGWRVVSFQTEVYNLDGLAVALGSAGETASALALVALLCAGAILTLAVMSARRPRLFRIWLLLLASLVGMGALGLLGAFAASGRVSLAAKNLYGSFLGFGPGFWVTTGSLALALVGGAVLHAAARPRRHRAPVVEIALALLGVVGQLSSAAAAAVVRPAQYPPLTCVTQGNAPHGDVGAVYFTSADGVYALDATSGQVRWRCRNPLGGFVTDGAPALADGVLFVASRDGYVYAIRANDATVLWHADVGGRNSYLLAPHVAPLVANGLVFGANGAGQVYALRTSDGGRAWSNAVSPPAVSRWTIPNLLLVNGKLIYPDFSLHLTVVDARSGRLLWATRDASLWISYPLTGDPITVNAGVIFDKEYSAQTRVVYLAARSLTNGALRWSLPLSAPDSLPFSSTFTVIGGVVYLEQRQEEGIPSVGALSADRGVVMWSIPPPDSVPNQVNPYGLAQDALFVGNDSVYVVASSVPGGPDTVFGFDVPHRAARWRYDFTRYTATTTGRSNLLLMGDSLYVLTHTGAVVAFDAHTGFRSWQFISALVPDSWAPVPGALTVGNLPAGGLASGLLYVATSRLYAINPSDGAVNWQFAPDQPVTPYAQPQSGYSPFVPSPIVSPPTLAP